jgi:hypothetical protein
MATIRVTRARNGAAAFDYAAKKTKAHTKDPDGVIDRRVLVVSAVNTTPKYAKQDMQAVWSAKQTQKKNQVEVYRITQSFGPKELDYHNKGDWKTANEIGNKFAEQLYPDKQVIVVTQADGEGHKLHNHILVNSVGFADGKALRAERTNQKVLAKVSDEIIQDYGMTPITPGKTWDKKTKAQQAMVEQGKSWVDDLKQHINKGLNDPRVVDWDSAVQVLANDYDVDVHVRRNKSGKVNGLSYLQLGTDRKRPVRANKLGAKYEVDNMEATFNFNKGKIKAEEKTNDKGQSLEADKKEADNVGLLDALGLGDPDKNYGGGGSLWDSIIETKEAEKENDMEAAARQKKAQAIIDRRKAQREAKLAEWEANLKENGPVSTIDKMKVDHDQQLAKEVKAEEKKVTKNMPKYAWSKIPADVPPVDPKSDQGKELYGLIKKHPGMELTTDKGIIIPATVKGKPNPEAAAYMSTQSKEELEKIDKAETTKEAEIVDKQALVYKIAFRDPSGVYNDKFGDHAYFKPYIDENGQVDLNKHKEFDQDTLNRMMLLSKEELEQRLQDEEQQEQAQKDAADLEKEQVEYDHDTGYKPGTAQFDKDNAAIMREIRKQTAKYQHATKQPEPTKGPTGPEM